MESVISKAKFAVENADAILVGASNGLSIAEGYNIFANNEMFKRQFADFERQYEIHSVLQGAFFHSETIRHEFQSRLVKLWIDDYRPSEVMKDLMKVIGDKSYFIITSNADTHLELSGFDKKRIFEVEGTFISAPTEKEHNEKYALLNDFLSLYRGKHIVILELGIGSRNTLIKQPLMQLAASEPNATYITLNLPNEIYVPSQIAAKSIALPGDIAHTLKELSE